MRRGFTLVELLVVMGIILILVSVAMPAVNSARLKAKDTEVRSGCNTIQVGLEQFAVSHAGGYPGAHWEADSAGNFYVGAGVLGAQPSYEGNSPRKDFSVPKTDTDLRGPLMEGPRLADGTPNVNSLDALVAEGFIDDYPANPFLRSTGSARSQMSNLFLFAPELASGVMTIPVVNRPDTLDFNRYTSAANNYPYPTMRQAYDDVARGHFSYIPLNPVDNTGYDYTDPNLTDAQKSDFYKRCRGYILVGWGHSRLDDTQAKGISDKYWNNSVDIDGDGTPDGSFDFDNSSTADPLEVILSNASAGGLVQPEMVDSGGSSGSFGQQLPGGGPNIDSAFFGAVFIKITGS